MEYQLNFYNLFMGFGMAHGFILGSVLFLRAKFKSHLKYLGFLLLTFSFYLLWVLKYDIGLQSKYPYLQLMPVLFIWGMGPAFYSYLKFLFGSPLTRRQLSLHFSLVILEVIIFNSNTLIWWANQWTYGRLGNIERFLADNIFSIEHVVGLFIFGVYLFKSTLFLKSKAIFQTWNKINALFMGIVLLWLIWVPYTLIDIVQYNFNLLPSNFYIFYILFTILIFYFGYLGFKIDASGYKPVQVNQSMGKENEKQEICNRIKSVMEQKSLYLDPDFCTKDLAEMLGVHPNKISAALNNIEKQSFRNYLNSYRIEAFKTKLEDYDSKKETLIGLAYESGFNSKASFNRCFKMTEGISPSEYLKRSQNTF